MKNKLFSINQTFYAQSYKLFFPHGVRIKIIEKAPTPRNVLTVFMVTELITMIILINNRT